MRQSFDRDLLTSRHCFFENLDDSLRIEWKPKTHAGRSARIGSWNLKYDLVLTA